ncbi:MAG: transcription termination/antitermination factor NusG [Clostridia bacterium]|nr:transcription termination/antitermination factor NusG [Clostridia bacterium]
MEEAKWYVLHTYSGYEDLVKKSIEQMVENNNLQDEIFEIKILVDETVEERNGKKKLVVTKIMPCYVYIKLKYSSQIWYLITNTRGVTGFVGPQGKALPLTDEEVKRLRLETVVTDFSHNVGDYVKVVSGPFEGQIGSIKSIDTAKQKESIVLSMFGRETNVDMDFIQIESAN